MKVANITATATSQRPYPPYTNCATVGTTPGSGYEDTNAGNKEAADKFQKVQAAYEVLRKAEERKSGKVA